MKLKTLLLVVAILCVSLFVVACGEDETTTAGENPDGTTAAATTTKETTKKTTKKAKVEEAAEAPAEETEEYEEVYEEAAVTEEV